MELTKRQKSALQLRAQGMSWESVCRQLGIQECTIQNWCRSDVFKAALEKAQQEFIDEQMAQLTAMLPIAVAKLGEALEKGGDTARMKAIELLAKWTGLAGGKSVKPEPVEGGISLDEFIQKQREYIAALESEDEPVDGG